MTVNLRTLEQFNDWWTTATVPARLLKPFKRPLFHELITYSDDRQMLLVYGLRRVGKTTIFYQLIQHLLEKGVEPRNILYFSFDVATATIEDVLRTYEQERLRRNFEDAARIFIFFDEIQKAEDWQNQLKIFYDLYPNLKIFICGSASINIQKKARESLAGRMFEFLLKPLSFREFLALKGIEVPFSEWRIHERRVLPHFHDYLLKGGFPELISEESEEKISNYLRSAVLERILFIDLPAEFGIKNMDLLKTLVEFVARDPGLIINYDELARDLKQSKPTIINYFGYLEYALILKLVRNLRPGFLATSRKLKRAYPTNVAFAHLFATNNNRGKVIETLLVQELDARYYYRDNSTEIDFILKNGKILPIEVKYGKIALAQFCRALDKTGLDHGLLITKDRYKEEKIGDKKILMVPVWAFVLFTRNFLDLLDS
jgi:predicted AAA+ superfamily ATPase